MDPLLLKYYERELLFIREMGAEYAREFPKIARRLGIEGTETADPYVERLYEGFAFLAARIHLRIDAEYPKFTQNLLNIVYPQFLTPIPSMAIVQFQPSANASLDAGVTIARGSALRSSPKDKQQTACEFRTAHDVTLWPVKIKHAEYFSNVSSFTHLNLPLQAKPKSGLRLRLASTADLSFKDIPLNDMVIYLCGQSGQAMRLYEQLVGNCCAVIMSAPEKASAWTVISDRKIVEPIGFENGQELLPDDKRTFSGYRLLREYFAFPDRFMFVKLSGLGRAASLCTGQEMDIVILFDRYDSELENRVTVDDFALNCATAINLFPKRADRIHLSNRDTEYHVVPDRTRPMDFEVFQVEGVTGFGSSAEQRTFLPFYTCNDLTNFPDHSAFYTLRRQNRVLSTGQRRNGPRSSYIGSECFISLVDMKEAPYPNDLKLLEVHTLCTNRDLPLQIAAGNGETDFTLDASAPVAAVRCIRGPTRPRPSLSHSAGETAWRLINQLSVNYLSLVDAEDGRGAAALRQLMSLYADTNDAVAKKQIESVRSIRAEQVTRRLPIPGPIAFGRGIRINVTFDESAFVGAGVFLLGAVLERFFARHVSINSFTETVINTVDRGEVMTWPARFGQRQIA